MNKNIQKKILELLDQTSLNGKPLREIAQLLGIKHPQTVKHYLNKLEIMGFIKINKEKKQIIRLARHPNTDTNLFSIPILGAANCGQALTFAEECFEGFLKISKQVLGKKTTEGLFAIRAVGDSMNRANIHGENVEEGDYVIVDTNEKTARKNDYILSIIDGMANIKKYLPQEKNETIALISESSREYPPIFITPSESSYFINGKIIKVIKDIKKDN